VLGVSTFVQKERLWFKIHSNCKQTPHKSDLTHENINNNFHP
jgi:hypothetical protein